MQLRDALDDRQAKAAPLGGRRRSSVETFDQTRHLVRINAGTVITNPQQQIVIFATKKNANSAIAPRVAKRVINQITQGHFEQAGVAINLFSSVALL